MNSCQTAISLALDDFPIKVQARITKNLPTTEVSVNKIQGQDSLSKREHPISASSCT